MPHWVARMDGTRPRLWPLPPRPPRGRCLSLGQLSTRLATRGPSLPGRGGMAWRKVWLNPVVTEFGWPPPDPASSPQWAFNQALRQLGIDRGEAFDEFDALNLGRHRHTEDLRDTD